MSNLWYHVSYFTQVLILSLFWVYRLKRRNCFILRVAAFTAVGAALIVLISYIQSLTNMDHWLIFTAPYMIIMALFGWGLWFCFDLTAESVFLILLLPTTMQLCGSSFSNFLHYYMNGTSANFYVNDIIATFVMCAVSFALVQLYNKIYFYDKNTYTLINIICYSVVLCLFLLNAFSRSVSDRFTRLVIISGYRFLMSAFVFFLIFSMLGLGGMRYQKSLTEALLKKEEQQRALASELSELINIKYHDIKKIENSGLAEEFVKQDEKLLDLYGCLVDCGNPALNTVLTEKNIICKNNRITFTVMADGKILNFMPQVDIYSLFGNALDNAIECLKELPVEERHVKLQVKNVGDMVGIICENTCHNKLKFENGLPRTTKNDTYNHGFGTKSIANVCKKYAAEFKMATNGEIFALNILIPATK